MRSTACIFLACLVVFAAAEAGVKLTITPRAIAAFKDEFLPKVVAQVQNLTVPEIKSGDLTITNFNLKSLALPTEYLNVKFGTNKLYLSSLNLGVNAQLSIYYRIWGYIPISTTIDCSTAESDIAFTISTTEDNKFSVNEFSVHIANLRVYFPESYIGFLYHGLIYIFTWPIESLLNSIIKSQVKTALQMTLNNAMTEMSHMIVLPNTTIGLDYAMESMPKITRDYMTVYINGTFYDGATNFSVPPVPAPRAYPEFDSTTGQDIQAFVSEYAFNTALYEVYAKGMMSATVTNDMIPKEAPVKFSTKWLKSFIPNIYNYFNDSSNITMGFSAAGNPQVTISPKDMKVNLESQLSFNFIDGDNVTQIIKVQGNLELHANITLANWTLKPTIISAQFGKFTVLESRVGDTTGDLFQKGFNVLFMFAIGGFNAEFKPVQLPKVPGVNLETSVVTFEDGHIRIQSTPSYVEANVQIDAPATPALRGIKF
mmetsp:Transcript_59049/g.68311  ORF Transcript_59049/g.68311 Transcript_59049/m.68311 type:complete len:484 (+) Transcript_59049:20-1471(+)